MKIVRVNQSAVVSSVPVDSITIRAREQHSAVEPIKVAFQIIVTNKKHSSDRCYVQMKLAHLNDIAVDGVCRMMVP